jgi:hypothetical protein
MPQFRLFLEKYCGQKIPDESTLRKKKMEIVEAVDPQLGAVRGEIGEKVHRKFPAVRGRHPGYSTLQSVCKIMSGEEDDLPDFSLEKVHLLKFAPVTSCDIERPFSAYKRIISDRRLNMTAGNME